MPTRWRALDPEGKPCTPWFDILPEDATKEEEQQQLDRQHEQYQEWKHD